MQTCSRCNSQSMDSASSCENCGADLKTFSATVVALKTMQANSRVVNIRLVVDYEACPACHEMQGTYAKDKVPALPIEGCSHPNGCRCFYEPMLDEIYP